MLQRYDYTSCLSALVKCRFFDEKYRMGCEGSVMEDPDNEYDSTWDDEYEEEPFGMMMVE